jgi:hypothetical protein
MTKYFTAKRGDTIRRERGEDDDDICQFGTLGRYTTSQLSDLLSEITTNEFSGALAVVEDLAGPINYDSDFNEDDEDIAEIIIIPSSSKTNSSTCTTKETTTTTTWDSACFFGNGRFEFIRNERDRFMYKAMHKAITTSKMWNYMRGYEPKDDESKGLFASSSSSSSKKKAKAMSSLKEFNGPDSVLSFAGLMRDMEFIAKHGYEALKEDTLKYYKRLDSLLVNQ